MTVPFKISLHSLKHVSISTGMHGTRFYSGFRWKKEQTGCVGPIQRHTLTHLRISSSPSRSLLHSQASRRMNFVVRLRSSTSSCNFRWSVVSVGQIADLSWPCLVQFWSICSVIQSSSPLGQAVDGIIFSCVFRWAFRRLCPVLSLTIIACSDLIRRW